MSQDKKCIHKQIINSSIVKYGIPSFYITISPADVHNFYCFHACHNFSNFDIDNLSSNLFNSTERHKLTANNPVPLAKFFNELMKIIFDCLFGFNNHNAQGIFGPCKQYYGMVETQARGSLHIHLLLWIDGQLPPNELFEKMNTNLDFQNKMITYLMNTISTDDSKYGPLEVNDDTIRNYSYTPLPSPSAESFLIDMGTDLCIACATPTQLHEHTFSCFKKGKTCRYRKPEPTFMNSHYDLESGKINLQKLNPMVNNFNPWLTLFTKSNTDVSYLQYGTSTLAVTYYITNYIT